MIRSIEPMDSPALVDVCLSTGIFQSDDQAELLKLFDDFHATHSRNGHHAITCEEGGKLISVAYFNLKPLTDCTWEIFLLMVSSARQNRGIGTCMLTAVENAVRRLDGRMMLVETLSTPQFDRTRQFYRRNGYAEVALVPDYYATGIGKVSFTKRVSQKLND